MGGGYIALEHLPDLQVRLRQNDHIIEEAMGAESMQALQFAMAYAVQHAAGILEASDIIVPFSGRVLFGCRQLSRRFPPDRY